MKRLTFTRDEKINWMTIAAAFGMLIEFIVLKLDSDQLLVSSEGQPIDWLGDDSDCLRLVFSDRGGYDFELVIHGEVIRRWWIVEDNAIKELSDSLYSLTQFIVNRSEKVNPTKIPL